MATNQIFGLLIRYVGLLLLQVFIIGKLHIHPFVQPNILILFFLMLPVDLKPGATLLLGFLGGLLLDVFSDSAGFNSTAVLVMMFARIYYVRAFASIDIQEAGVRPNIGNTGYRWYIFYSASMVLVYHLVYSFIESFRVVYFLSNIASAIMSAAVSLALIFLFQLLFFRTRKGERV
ncbi:MAG: hypothetical protein EP332_13760 [Bacteroidetes bacterium]|nr:MAG: hypothetical protein EP332_13760 [Bacteroidota bacterium]